VTWDFIGKRRHGIILGRESYDEVMLIWLFVGSFFLACQIVAFISLRVSRFIWESVW